jgi:hypothetical protein
MLKHGISPHIILAFDGNKVNAEIYNNLSFKDIYLFYSNRFYPESLQQFSGKKVHMKLDVESFSDMITYKSGGYEYGTIRSGFSVSHSALDLAFKFGCDPIVLIGQDLAYTGNKRYADGQITSSQQIIESGNIPLGCYITQDIYGEDVYTDPSFESVKIWFEQIIKDHYAGKAEIINATEAGLSIKGTVNRKLDEVIEEYCQKEAAITRKLSQCYQRGYKELNKFVSKISCIPSQIDFLMKEGIKKMDDLIYEIQELRKINFIEDSDFKGLDQRLAQINTEYEAVLNYREYEVLLLDLRVARVSANQVRIAKLGKIEDKEQYETKLQCWMNIFNETKIYLEHIRDCNQELTGLEEMPHENGARAVRR